VSHIDEAFSVQLDGKTEIIIITVIILGACLVEGDIEQFYKERAETSAITSK